MELFQRPNTSAPEKSQPGDSDYIKPSPTAPTTDTSNNERPATIPRLIILIVVVVALGIVLTHNGTKPAPKSPAKSGASHNVQKAPTASPKPAAAGSNNSAQPATGNLTNTGPSDVIGWFVTTVVAATGAHYIVVLRRLKTN